MPEKHASSLRNYSQSTRRRIIHNTILSTAFPETNQSEAYVARRRMEMSSQGSLVRQLQRGKQAIKM